MTGPEHLNIAQLARAIRRVPGTVRYRLRLMRKDSKRDLLPWPPGTDPVLGSPRWTAEQVKKWCEECTKKYGSLP